MAWQRNDLQHRLWGRFEATICGMHLNLLNTVFSLFCYIHTFLESNRTLWYMVYMLHVVILYMVLLLTQSIRTQIRNFEQHSCPYQNSQTWAECTQGNVSWSTQKRNFCSWPVDCAQWTTFSIGHYFTENRGEITTGWEKLLEREEMQSGISAHQLEEVSNARFQPGVSQ